jgi:hypothetical protein
VDASSSATGSMGCIAAPWPRTPHPATGSATRSPLDCSSGSSQPLREFGTQRLQSDVQSTR